MKKFEGNKDLDTLVKDAEASGWDVDMEEFDKGSDWIHIVDPKVRLKHIAFNVVNGSFYVYEPFSDTATATHLSEEFDNEDWYNEILELLYEPIKV